MALKDILVHTDDTPQGSGRLQVATRLAQAHQAHLTALCATPRPAAGDDGGIAVEWRQGEAAALPLHARYADLTVVGQPHNGSNLAETLVLNVGRPALVIPWAGVFPTLGERILVAWNASREACRAVHDALPLLVRARIVRILVVEDSDSRHGEVPGADIALHLSRHGVAATCEQVEARGMETGDMLLSCAADDACDLIVMGAFGRSPLHEALTGGTSRHLLRHMTVPVLMSR